MIKKKVYVVLYDKWPIKVFSIKSQAEGFVNVLDSNRFRNLYEVVELDLD